MTSTHRRSSRARSCWRAARGRSSCGSCSSATGPCRGSLSLRTAKAYRQRSGRHAGVTLAGASFTIASGHSATVRLHLTVAARTLLAKRHTLRVQGAISTRTGSRRRPGRALAAHAPRRARLQSSLTSSAHPSSPRHRPDRRAAQHASTRLEDRPCCSSSDAGGADTTVGPEPFVSMRTFLETTSRRAGAAIRGLLSGRCAPAAGGRPRGEDGFLLVEVMMSALLVGLIVVATFNGLDVATRLSADQRRRRGGAARRPVPGAAAQRARERARRAREQPPTPTPGRSAAPPTRSRRKQTRGASGGENTGCNVTEATAEHTPVSSAVTLARAAAKGATGPPSRRPA